LQEIIWIGSINLHHPLNNASNELASIFNLAMRFSTTQSIRGGIRFWLGNEPLGIVIRRTSNGFEVLVDGLTVGTSNYSEPAARRIAEEYAQERVRQRLDSLEHPLTRKFRQQVREEELLRQKAVHFLEQEERFLSDELDRINEACQKRQNPKWGLGI
jgi:hypothetical protein